MELKESDDFSIEEVIGLLPGESQVKDSWIIPVGGSKAKMFQKTIHHVVRGEEDLLIFEFTDHTHEQEIRKNIEDALEIAKSANAAKSSFLSNMSHDIRTPMNVITGLSKLMKHELGNPVKMKEYIEKIQTSSSHLLGLINDVLDMEHIFEPFSRQENSVTNRVQGTGLGMAITKNIVDMMGGTIHVDSCEGKGSSFEVVLEFRINKEAEHDSLQLRESSKNDSVESEILKGKRFLCAEDNELNAEILQALLETEGASCEICPNGVEIVNRFTDVVPGEFDMILMDVQMPLMNGYEATKAIRQSRNPLGQSIPIVAMTANAFADDIQQSMDAGMNEHISKPMDLLRLKKVVAKLLEN